MAPSGWAAVSQNPASLLIPAEFGEIKDVHSGAVSAPLLIHVQDAHANVSGQENIAKLLDAVFSRYGTVPVLVEGGTKDDSLTALKAAAPAAAWKKAARKFLLEGKIAGEEYLNLTSERPMKILGVEDEPAYRKGLEAYADLAQVREEALGRVKRLRAAAAVVKRAVYPKELRELDDACGREERITDCAKRLVSFPRKRESGELGPRLRGDDGPNLEAFRQALEKEGAVDFDAARLEQAAVFEKIGRVLSESEKKALGAQAASGFDLSSRAGSFSVFEASAARAGVRLEQYPALTAYRDYLAALRSIRFEEFFGEVERSVDARFESAGQDVRDLRAVDRRLALMEKAQEIRMSSEEFKELSGNALSETAIEAYLNRRLAERGSFRDLMPASERLTRAAPFVDGFYRSAAERDETFVRNAEKWMKAENANVAVLIAGGYHSDALKKRFRDKGWSYAVVTPRVTSETIQEKYERILLEPVRKPHVIPAQAGIQSPGSPIKDFGDDNAKSSGIVAAKLAETMAGARMAELLSTVESFDGTGRTFSGARLAQAGAQRKSPGLISMFESWKKDIQASGRAVPVFLLSGFPASGKSTTAERFADYLKAGGKDAVVIHGDFLRKKSLAGIFIVIYKYLVDPENFIGAARKYLFDQDLIDQWSRELEDVRMSRRPSAQIQTPGEPAPLWITKDTVVICESVFAFKIFEALAPLKSILIDVRPSTSMERHRQRAVAEGRHPLAAFIQSHLLFLRTAARAFAGAKQSYDEVWNFENINEPRLETKLGSSPKPSAATAAPHHGARLAEPAWLSALDQAIEEEFSRIGKQPEVFSTSTGIYKPTPLRVIWQRLAQLGIGPGKRLVDLGSGDGRVVFVAALMGAEAAGFEDDEDLVRLSSAVKGRLSEHFDVSRADFIKGDFFNPKDRGERLRKADLVYYFWTGAMPRATTTPGHFTANQDVIDLLRREIKQAGQVLLYDYDSSRHGMPFKGWNIVPLDSSAGRNDRAYQRPETGPTGQEKSGLSRLADSLRFWRAPDGARLSFFRDLYQLFFPPKPAGQRNLEPFVPKPAPSYAPLTPETLQSLALETGMDRDYAVTLHELKNTSIGGPSHEIRFESRSKPVTDEEWGRAPQRLKEFGEAFEKRFSSYYLIQAVDAEKREIRLMLDKFGARLASVSQSIDQMPYRPYWLGKDLRIEIEEKLPKILDIQEIRKMPVKEKSKAIHHILASTVEAVREAVDQLLSAQNFDWSRLTNYMFNDGTVAGRGVWARLDQRKKPSGERVAQFVMDATLQIKFEGSTIDLSQKEKIAKIVSGFVDREFNDSSNADIKEQLTAYLFDLVLHSYGIDAIKGTANLLVIKNPKAIKSIRRFYPNQGARLAGRWQRVDAFRLEATSRVDRLLGRPNPRFKPWSDGLLALGTFGLFASYFLEAFRDHGAHAAAVGPLGMISIGALLAVRTLTEFVSQKPEEIQRPLSKSIFWLIGLLARPLSRSVPLARPFIVMPRLYKYSWEAWRGGQRSLPTALQTLGAIDAILYYLPGNGILFISDNAFALTALFLQGTASTLTLIENWRSAKKAAIPPAAHSADAGSGARLAASEFAAGGHDNADKVGRDSVAVMKIALRVARGWTVSGLLIGIFARSLIPFVFSPIQWSALENGAPRDVWNFLVWTEVAGFLSWIPLSFLTMLAIQLVMNRSDLAARSYYGEPVKFLALARALGILDEDLARMILKAKTSEELYTEWNRHGLLRGAAYDLAPFETFVQSVWEEVKNSAPLDFPPIQIGEDLGLFSQAVEISGRTFLNFGAIHGTRGMPQDVFKVRQLVRTAQAKGIPLYSEQNFQRQFAYRYGVEVRDVDLISRAVLLGHIALSWVTQSMTLGAILARPMPWRHYLMPRSLRHKYAKVSERSQKIAETAYADASGAPVVATLSGAGHVDQISRDLKELGSRLDNTHVGARLSKRDDRPVGEKILSLLEKQTAERPDFRISATDLTDLLKYNSETPVRRALAELVGQGRLDTKEEKTPKGKNIILYGLPGARLAAPGGAGHEDLTQVFVDYILQETDPVILRTLKIALEEDVLEVRWSLVLAQTRLLSKVFGPAAALVYLKWLSSMDKLFLQRVGRLEKWILGFSPEATVSRSRLLAVIHIRLDQIESGARLASPTSSVIPDHAEAWTDQLITRLEGVERDPFHPSKEAWQIWNGSLSDALAYLVRLDGASKPAWVEADLPLPNEQEMERIGDQLRAYWKKRRLEGPWGLLNQHMALLERSYQRPESMLQTNRLLMALLGGSVDERLTGLWAKGVQTAFHVRELGGYSESVNGVDRSLDNELLADILRRYIPLLVYRLENPLKNSTREVGYEREQYENLLLWGLAVMLDPANFVVHTRTDAEGKDHEVRPDAEQSKKDVMRYLLGDKQMPGALEKLNEVDSQGEATGRLLSDKKIGALIHRILTSTESDWTGKKGLVSPWRAATNDFDVLVYEYLMFSQKASAQPVFSFAEPDVFDSEMFAFSPILKPSNKRLEFAEEVFGDWPEFYERFPEAFGEGARLADRDTGIPPLASLAGSILMRFRVLSPYSPDPKDISLANRFLEALQADKDIWSYLSQDNNIFTGLRFMPRSGDRMLNTKNREFLSLAAQMVVPLLHSEAHYPDRENEDDWVRFIEGVQSDMPSLGVAAGDAKTISALLAMSLMSVMNGTDGSTDDELRMPFIEKLESRGLIDGEQLRRMAGWLLGEIPEDVNYATTARPYFEAGVSHQFEGRSPEEQAALVSQLLELNRRIDRLRILSRSSLSRWTQVLMMAAELFDAKPGVDLRPVRKRLHAAPWMGALDAVFRKLEPLGLTGGTLTTRFTPSDLSTALVMTDADTLRFYDVLPFGSNADAAKAEDLKEFYISSKAETGYLSGTEINAIGNARAPILWELDALGARNVQIESAGPGVHHVRFLWSHDGKAPARQRLLIYTQREFQSPEDFQGVVESGDRFYLHKAPLNFGLPADAALPPVLLSFEDIERPGYVKFLFRDLPGFPEDAFLQRRQSTYANIRTGAVFIREDILAAAPGARLAGPVGRNGESLVQSLERYRGGKVLEQLRARFGDALPQVVAFLKLTEDELSGDRAALSIRSLTRNKDTARVDWFVVRAPKHHARSFYVKGVVPNAFVDVEAAAAYLKKQERNAMAVHRLGLAARFLFVRNDKEPMLLMERTEGRLLKEKTKDADIAFAIGRALGRLHGAGLLHGDADSEHVYVRSVLIKRQDRKRIKVTFIDFGSTTNFLQDDVVKTMPPGHPQMYFDIEKTALSELLIDGTVMDRFERGFEEGFGRPAPAGARLAEAAVSPAAKKPLSRGEVYEWLKSKYGTRYFLNGGPLAQPNYFAPLRSDEETIGNLARTYGIHHFSKQLLPSRITEPSALAVQELAQRLEEGTLAEPVVVKRNFSALGVGVLFVEKSADGWKLTSANLSQEDEDRARAALQGISGASLMADARQHILQIRAPLGSLAEVMTAVWRELSVQRFTGSAYYDPGMVEAMVPLFRYQGRSYETRHAFQADFETGSVEWIKEKIGPKGWFGRIGSSAYFSNQGFRQGDGEGRNADHMFDPLFEELHIPPQLRREFEQQIESVLKEELRFLNERLRSLGISLAKMKGQFDLGWIAPEPGEKFPRPMLIEAHFEPDTPREADLSADIQPQPSDALGARLATNYASDPAANIKEFVPQILLQWAPNNLGAKLALDGPSGLSLAGFARRVDGWEVTYFGSTGARLATEFVSQEALSVSREKTILAPGTDDRLRTRALQENEVDRQIAEENRQIRVFTSEIAKITDALDGLMTIDVSRLEFNGGYEISPEFVENTRLLIKELETVRADARYAGVVFEFTGEEQHVQAALQLGLNRYRGMPPQIEAARARRSVQWTVNPEKEGVGYLFVDYAKPGFVQPVRPLLYYSLYLLAAHNVAGDPHPMTAAQISDRVLQEVRRLSGNPTAAELTREHVFGFAQGYVSEELRSIALLYMIRPIVELLGARLAEYRNQVFALGASA